MLIMVFHQKQQNKSITKVKQPEAKADCTKAAWDPDHLKNS